MTNTEIKLRGMYNDLSNTQRRIADYFLGNTDNIFNLPISDLAIQSGVSQVAWVRFCKLLGFNGLKEMKKALYTEINGAANEGSTRDTTAEFSDIKNFTTVDQICEAIRTRSIQAIDDSIQILDRNVMASVVDAIIQSDSVQIFGVGASGSVGADLYYKLLRINKHAIFDRDIHIQLTYAATLKSSDVAIFISNSGLTTEVLDLLEIAQKSSATLIAITKFCKNPLATACDYTIYTSSSESDRRSGAMSSRIAQLCLIDILFTAIANRDYANVETALESSHNSCASHKRRE